MNRQHPIPPTVWIFGAGLAILTIVRLIPYLPVPLPVCGLRALTGIPCPFCGSTRCLMAWSHLDVAQAFRFNPLVATAVAGLAGWLVVRALDYCFGGAWAKSIQGQAHRTPWPAILIVAALANWAYLICSLPR